MLRMQMSMMVYSMVDLLDEKQRIKSSTQRQAYQSYLGLLQECFLSQFQLDIYGKITCTNYKVIIMKNEAYTVRDGSKTAPTKLIELFSSVAVLHAQMLLNPFYEAGAHCSPLDATAADELNSEESSNSDCSSCSSRSSRGSQPDRDSFEKEKKTPQGPLKNWSTKQWNRECLNYLKRQIDLKVKNFENISINM